MAQDTTTNSSQDSGGMTKEELDTAVERHIENRKDTYVKMGKL